MPCDEAHLARSGSGQPIVTALFGPPLGDGRFVASVLVLRGSRAAKRRPASTTFRLTSTTISPLFSARTGRVWRTPVQARSDSAFVTTVRRLMHGRSRRSRCDAPAERTAASERRRDEPLSTEQDGDGPADCDQQDRKNGERYLPSDPLWTLRSPVVGTTSFAEAAGVGPGAERALGLGARTEARSSRKSALR